MAMKYQLRLAFGGKIKAFELTDSAVQIDHMFSVDLTGAPHSPKVTVEKENRKVIAQTEGSGGPAIFFDFDFPGSPGTLNYHIEADSGGSFSITNRETNKTSAPVPFPAGTMDSSFNLRQLET